MREPESYWSRKSPPIPEAHDLPSGSFSGDEVKWYSLSPGMRREIWRDAIYREAMGRNLSPEIISRVRTMTISGSLSSLDEYLDAIAQIDARRPPVKEDVEMLERADMMHRKSEVQIAAREAV